MWISPLNILGFTGLLGGGPPQRSRGWFLAEKARKAQEEKEQKEMDERIKRAEEKILPYKKCPKPSMVPQWEGSQASSNPVTINTDINPESVASVTSTGTTLMRPSDMVELSQLAKCTTVVFPLRNSGNICFANAGIENY